MEDPSGMHRAVSGQHVPSSGQFRRSPRSSGYGILIFFFALLTASCAKRANPAPPVAAPPFEFLGAWGNRGQGPGQLDEPIAFATDALGNVFVADPGSGFVHKFEPQGTPLLSFTDSRVRYASGIAVDRGGAIYLSSATHGTITLFFPDGAYLRTVQMPSQPQFRGPHSMAIDSQGNTYVAGLAGTPVIKLDGRGRIEKSWHPPVNTASSEDLPVQIAIAGDDSVVILYPHTGRVERYGSDGSAVAQWDTASTSTATKSEQHALPATGMTASGAYVFTAGAGHLQVWTLDGKLMMDDTLGGGLAGIATPQLAATPRQELLVFDRITPRVLRFRFRF